MVPREEPSNANDRNNHAVWRALTQARTEMRDPGLYRWPPHANLLYPFVDPYRSSKSSSTEQDDDDQNGNTEHDQQEEINKAHNPRIHQSDAILDTLVKLRQDNTEAVVLVGDMGDGYTARHLFQPAGLQDPFSTLGLPVEATFPASGPSVVRDWIFANNRIRPLLASVVRFRQDDVSISHHWPVMAMYELLPIQTSTSFFRRSISA